MAQHEDNSVRERHSAIVLKNYGGLDQIEVREIESKLTPDENQVVVAVKACGLNFADIYTRQGLIRDRQPPFTLGLECAGVVKAVGQQVTQLKIGDRVLVHTGEPGLQSSLVCVDSTCCFIIPDAMTFEDAAAFPVNYLTAYFCLFNLGNLRPSQVVLIPSAGGGVGWAATQLAKSVPGVRVVGIASQPKHAAIRDNGVDVVIDSMDPNWDAAVKKACPDGVDIALVLESGSTISRTQALLGHLGRMILLGANDMIGGDVLSLWRIIQSWWKTKLIKPVDLLMNSQAVAGFHLTNLKKRMPNKYREALDHLFSLYEKGTLKPRIDSVWSFDQIKEATKRLSARENVGKVIVISQ